MNFQLNPPTFLLGWLPSFRALTPEAFAKLLQAADSFVRSAPRPDRREWDLRGRLVRAFADLSGQLAQIYGLTRDDLALALSEALSRASQKPMDFLTPGQANRSLQELAELVKEELSKKDESLKQKLSPELLTMLVMGELQRQFEFEEETTSHAPGTFRSLPPLLPLPEPRFRLPPLPSPFKERYVDTRGTLRNALPGLGLSRGKTPRG